MIVIDVEWDPIEKAGVPAKRAVALSCMLIERFDADPTNDDTYTVIAHDVVSAYLLAGSFRGLPPSYGRALLLNRSRSVRNEVLRKNNLGSLVSQLDVLESSEVIDVVCATASGIVSCLHDDEGWPEPGDIT